MKIMIVTTEYGNSGGVQTMVTSLLAAIKRHTDWDVEIASLRMSWSATESRRLLAPRSWSNTERISATMVDGIRVHNVGSTFAELESARYWPRPWLDKLLADSDAIVVVAGSPAVSVAVKRMRTGKVLQVATMAKLERAMRNRQLRGLRGIYRRLSTAATDRLDRVGLSIPDQVLVINDVMLSEVAKLGARRVELLPPGIDTVRFAPAPRTVESSYFLMVARLADPRKNVEGLLRAYKRARDMHGLTQGLILAGFNPPTQENLRLIEYLGLSAHVVVESPLSDAQLVALYQQADLLVSCSFEEGLGITMLEAMACGTPVMASNTAGAMYVLGDSEAGELVTLGDDFTGRFASRMAAWGNKNEADRARSAEQARRRVTGMFSAEASEVRIVRAIELVSRPKDRTRRR